MLIVGKKTNSGGRDGLALSKLMDRFPDLPTLIITGYGAQVVPAGMPIFAKPFDSAELLSAVEHAYPGGHA